MANEVAARAWAAGGRYVLFTKYKLSPDGSTIGSRELWIIPAEGGEPQKLLEMDWLDHISVHPDGQRIVFAGGRWPAGEVWAMENFLP